MLTAPDTGTNAIAIADDFVNKTLPVAGRRNEMTVTTVTGGHEVSGAQILSDDDASELLADAGMNRAMEPAFTKKIIEARTRPPVSGAQS